MYLTLNKLLTYFTFGVTNSYVVGLVFLRLGVSIFGFGLVILTFGVFFLRLGVRASYVCWLVFLRLGIRDSYVWGLVFLRLGVSFLKFGG